MIAMSLVNGQTKNREMYYSVLYEIAEGIKEIAQIDCHVSKVPQAYYFMRRNYQIYESNLGKQCQFLNGYRHRFGEESFGARNDL